MDLLDPQLVIKGGSMQELSKTELLDIIGGATLSATLISALVRGAELSFETGQCLGGAIRRLLEGKYCRI